AEELIIARDIKLARYTESKIHFTGVTSAKSIEYIKRAKDSGLNVTCSITPYHLYFTDEDLMEYDTNLKVYPPLRTKTEVSALKKAVTDGTIDCIASHHLPHEYDSKIVEFEYAKYGMTGLETAYSVVKAALPELKEDRLIELFSSNARKIFGLKKASITEKETACITLFNPSGKWILKEENIRSKSKNTPFINKEFVGKLMGIINGEKVFLNN
ncbi:MAG: dihydroorotase, partial [Bacteroidetes bacterium]|nr:dihydroorotase [Bacteroidota bacterium]